MGKTANDVMPCVVLCTGSDCAKDERRAYEKLRDAVDDAGLARSTARCLGVCHGPVAVVESTGASPVVLRRLRGRGARRALVELGRSGTVDGGVRRFEVTGKKARRAVRRARERAA